MKMKSKRPTKTKAIARALEADYQRRLQIVSHCEAAGLELDFADELCDSRASVEVAFKLVLERVAAKSMFN